MTTPWAVLLGVAMTAFSKAFISYSVLVKQYSSDALITIGLLLAVLPLLKAGPWRRASVLVYATVAALAVWFSHPAIFTVAGTAFTAFAVHAVAGRWRHATRICAATAPAMIGLGAEYFLILGAVSHSTYLHDYWMSAFLPRPMRFGTSVRWLAGAMVEPMEAFGGFKLHQIDRIGFVLGIVFLLVRSPRTLALLLTPALFALAAAALQAYPFAERLALFVLALLYLITAIGVCSLSQILPRKWGDYVAVCLAGALLIPAVVLNASWMWQPQPVEEIKPVLAYVRQHIKPHDIIYVFKGAVPAFLFYETNQGLDHAEAVLGQSTESEKLKADVAQLPASRKVWIIVAHTDADGLGSRAVPLFNALGANRSKLLEFDGPGETATACLYQVAR